MRRREREIDLSSNCCAAHGADPNAHSDSGGNSVFAAKTREIRTLLEAHGGTVIPMIWSGWMKTTK
jgi:hypothetical protein